MAKMPNIPKRLAARIRGAQEKVKQARLAIKADEFNGRQLRSRVDEFETDPEAFAAKYYGRNGPESYPVQTNIERARERLDYIDARRERRAGELATAEANLEQAEALAMAEVSVMRPTSGRVPWPKRLPSFAGYKEEVTRELEGLRAEHKKCLAQVEADYERELRELEAQQAEEDERELKAYRAALEKMTPDQRERERAANEFILNGLRSGAFTAADIIAKLRSG